MSFDDPLLDPGTAKERWRACVEQSEDYESEDHVEALATFYRESPPLRLLIREIVAGRRYLVSLERAEAQIRANAAPREYDPNERRAIVVPPLTHVDLNFDIEGHQREAFDE
jgi:hypothetical protein